MNYLDKTGLQQLWGKITSIFAKKTDVPSKTSQLTNDSSFITKSAGDEAFAKLSIYGDISVNLGRKTGHTPGEKSVAMGRDCTATNIASIAEGLETTAYGIGAHSEGGYCIASSNFSHAEGQSAVVEAEGGHAEGRGVNASSPYQHVQGKWNVIDGESKYVHIVGQGTSNNDRKNIHTVDTEGNAWFEGDVYVGSNSGINKDEGSKRLAKYWTGTQDEYNAIELKDENTLYLITGARVSSLPGEEVAGGVITFMDNKIIFNMDDGSVQTTTFNSDGSITEVETNGSSIITTHTVFNSDGSIRISMTKS